MNPSGFVCTLAATAVMFLGASALAASSPAPAGDYNLRLGVKIPMRDHVELNATVYVPGANGTALPRTPVVFTLTPYTADNYHARGAYFAAHGYVFAIVDARGRGNSDGTFDPFAQEPHDAYDAVEWLAQQPYCNGKVSMWGGSYAGFDQWAAAREFPPHLAAIAPAAAAHPGVDFPFVQNVAGFYVLQWLTLVGGRTGQENLFGDQKFWASQFLRAYRQHVPIKSIDAFTGNPSPLFQRFFEHPTPDPYYDAMTPSAEQYRKLDLPILTITGQYDGDELGALTYYRRHLANATPEARAKHFLIIGPWDHAGTRTPADEVGGVKSGAGSVLDLNDLHRQWYDWTLQDSPKPEFLQKPVAYYLLAPGNAGANGEWKYAETLEELTANPRLLYLDSPGGENNGVFHSGALVGAPPREGRDQYLHDPMDTSRGESIDGGEPNDRTSGIDQRYALSIGKDGLVYHTESMRQETPLIGCPSLKLWVALDVPDADIEANLYEIQPDGTSILLWSDVRRLRYRESMREEKLVRPGEIVPCNLAPGLFVARRLMKESRLRLVVSSPNSIWVQGNYHSGGAVASETAADAHVAHIQIWHDAQHPSALLAPLR